MWGIHLAHNLETSEPFFCSLSSAVAFIHPLHVDSFKVFSRETSYSTPNLHNQPQSLPSSPISREVGAVEAGNE